jgi:uncharacterized protein YndB with AHSA1/START domain
MIAPSVVHGSFTVERRFPAQPARVFAAFADPALKARWFSGPDGWTPIERSVDFREGGRERHVGRWPSGLVTAFDAHYHDIVQDRRIVYSYVMHLDDRRISVSLATIEILPNGDGTRLVVTEQGAFLDGYDDNGSREHGTGFLMDRLGAALLE